MCVSGSRHLMITYTDSNCHWWHTHTHIYIYIGKNILYLTWDSAPFIHFPQNISEQWQFSFHGKVSFLYSKNLGLVMLPSIKCSWPGTWLLLHTFSKLAEMRFLRCTLFCHSLSVELPRWAQSQKCTVYMYGYCVQRVSLPGRGRSTVYSV